MKAIFKKYLNEFVGLTVMALMVVAFVAAQADADIQRAAADEARDVVEVRLSAID